MAKHRISERDYIVVSNLQRSRLALHVIHQISTGNRDQYGAKKAERDQIIEILDGWIETLEKLVDTSEGE